MIYYRESGLNYIVLENGFSINENSKKIIVKDKIQIKNEIIKSIIFDKSKIRGCELRWLRISRNLTLDYISEKMLINRSIIESHEIMSMAPVTDIIDEKIRSIISKEIKENNPARKLSNIQTYSGGRRILRMRLIKRKNKEIWIPTKIHLIK